MSHSMYSVKNSHHPYIYICVCDKTTVVLVSIAKIPLHHNSLYKEKRDCSTKQRNTGNNFQLCLFLILRRGHTRIKFGNL